MFMTIFAFGIIVAHVTAKLPSYIHVCDRKDANYNQCIANSINNLKDKICTGFSEFNIPPTEPVIFDKIVIVDAKNVKLYLEDAKMKGICDYTVNSVNADLNTLHFDINFFFPHIYLNTIYDFDIRLLVRIANKGMMKVILDNVQMKAGLDLKVITRHDKKYIFASKTNVKVADNTTFTYIFDDNGKELTQLHKILDEFITTNKEEITNVAKPIAEEKISKIILSLFNNITFSNYEELFPET